MKCEKLNKFALSHAEVVKNFGVWFDCDFSFLRHLQSTCKAFFTQIRDFKKVRWYFT